MCVLCGDLWTEEHWAEIEADERPQPPDATMVLEVHVDRRGQRLRDRARRARLVSAVFASYGLSFQDWEGSSYILRDAKGNSAIAPDLASLWPAVERIVGTPLDLLSPEFLNRMQARARAQANSAPGSDA